MKNIQQIKDLVSSGSADEVIRATDEWISAGTRDADMAMALYLRGNAFRQKQQWGSAMNCYLQAIEIAPDGPAVEAYRNAQDILAYYHKDYYNP